MKTKNPSTALVYHPDCLLHDPGPYHPEKPARLKAVIEDLKDRDLRLDRIRPGPADIAWIVKNHDPEYVQWVESMCQKGPAILDTGDTVVSPDSFGAARLAAGGVLAAVDAVTQGRAQNAFCAVRPPGHHAVYDRAMGFCLFNNIAVGAHYAREAHGIEKILIADWDAHHGNGTQDAFYGDLSVFYFSIHQSPHYPGTGRRDETGSGRGKGFTLNVPLPAGSGDAQCIGALKEGLVPAMEKFRPDLVMISCGFDAFAEDPLSGLEVTARGFIEMAQIANDIASKYSDGRLVSVFEGGYVIEKLPGLVKDHLGVLMS